MSLRLVIVSVVWSQDDVQKRQREKYQEELREQIEQRKQLEAEKKRQVALEDEK